MENLEQQKGVALIIVFLVTLVILAAVLSIGTLLFNKVKIVSSASSATSALNGAYASVEETLYYNKQVPQGAFVGVCNMCPACLAATTPGLQCNTCTTTGSDCNACTSCLVNFTATYNSGQTATVVVAVNQTSDIATQKYTNALTITSTGNMNAILRTIIYTYKTYTPF